jgi:hypothetical protein
LLLGCFLTPAHAFTIDNSGYNTELEVYDNDTGEYRTFEMED